MSIHQLLVLAVVAMAGLVALRLVRVRLGRTPFPEARGAFLLVLAFLFVPPIALIALAGPTTTEGTLSGAAPVAVYIAFILGITIVMAIAARIARWVAPGRSHRLLLTALIGSEGHPDFVRADASLTPALAADVALVEKTNAVFPRGVEFPQQVDRAGFRSSWDALDAATATLEEHIAGAHSLGVAVASRATATARDARSRLETLRRLADHRGQAWAS